MAAFYPTSIIVESVRTESNMQGQSCGAPSFPSHHWSRTRGNSIAIIVIHACWLIVIAEKAGCLPGLDFSFRTAQRCTWYAEDRHLLAKKMYISEFYGRGRPF